MKVIDQDLTEIEFCIGGDLIRLEEEIWIVVESLDSIKDVQVVRLRDGRVKGLKLGKKVEDVTNSATLKVRS